MSVKFWDQGSVFPTLLSQGNLRVYFSRDLFFDVPFANTTKDFVINNRIPVGDISLLCENPDGEIIVGWRNGEVKVYNTNYGNFFRLVGYAKFDIYKVMEDNLEVLTVGSTRQSKINESKVTRSDLFYTRYYIVKKNPNYLIMDTSDGRPPVIINIEKNPEIAKLILIKGSGADPMFIRQEDVFEEASTGLRIKDPVIIPQPQNNPRLIRRAI